MPPVLQPSLTLIDRPHHDMCCARADFVIASGAPIVLDGTRPRYGPHLVVEPVGADLDPALTGQRR
jgi:hypothetical protein